MVDKNANAPSQAIEAEIARADEGYLTDAELQAVAGGFASSMAGTVRVFTGAIGGLIGGAIRGATSSLGK
ncbi:hypothetical protein W911_11690 [Hyphomicrobium nitrativorans NL23]|uniref:Uncharacterized protein n=1 Tax=Hyphomicrobium nitrativorans NL23 TaxID=1029756 RepID=V5SI61_9HYPH|nr:hypothetical protein [Hyphomicrobium nitrativorans]AHB50228.1 hypothetical protein W911_11690 [Hyphomicrobium nitrativorans NL23]